MRKRTFIEYVELHEIDSTQDHNQALKDTGFWGRAGAGVIFLSQDSGRILLAHRSDSVEQPDTWGTWGGAIDQGESPLEAAVRETEEEAGFKPGVGDILPLYVFSDPSGFKFYNFLVVTENEFKPKLTWETQDYKWVEYGTWPSPIHFGLKSLLGDPASKDIIEELVQQYTPQQDQQTQ